MNENILKKLIKEEKKAKDEEEIPVSAVITDKNGNIISYAHNTRQKDHNVLGHAEINAIIKAEKIIGDWRLDGYNLYVTLEPCDMCSVIIKECRLDNVYFLLGNNHSNEFYLENKYKIEENKYSHIVDELKKDIKSFFEEKR